MAEDRSKPPPGYEAYLTEGRVLWRAAALTAGGLRGKADAVAACWEHRDRVIDRQVDVMLEQQDKLLREARARGIEMAIEEADECREVLQELAEKVRHGDV